MPRARPSSSVRGNTWRRRHSRAYGASRDRQRQIGLGPSVVQVTTVLVSLLLAFIESTSLATRPFPCVRRFLRSLTADRTRSRSTAGCPSAEPISSPLHSDCSVAQRFARCRSRAGCSSFFGLRLISNRPKSGSAAFGRQMRLRWRELHGSRPSRSGQGTMPLTRRSAEI
jgi:hypothetical protein